MDALEVMLPSIKSAGFCFCLTSGKESLGLASLMGFMRSLSCSHALIAAWQYRSEDAEAAVGDVLGICSEVAHPRHTPTGTQKVVRECAWSPDPSLEIASSGSFALLSIRICQRRDPRAISVYLVGSQACIVHSAFSLAVSRMEDTPCVCHMRLTRHRTLCLVDQDQDGEHSLCVSHSLTQTGPGRWSRGQPRVQYLVSRGLGDEHGGHGDPKGGRHHLRHLGVQPLPHLHAAVGHQHRAVCVHVHQRSPLHQKPETHRSAMGTMHSTKGNQGQESRTEGSQARWVGHPPG